MNVRSDANNRDNNVEIPAWLEVVRRQIEKTDFGVVQVVIHNSKVVRIERTEKILIEKPDELPARKLVDQF